MGHRIGLVAGALLAALALPAPAEAKCAWDAMANPSPTEIIDDCTALLSQEKRPAERSKILVFRGSIYLSLQEDATGLADYAEAIRLDPTNSEAYQSRARFYAGNARDLAAALADVTTAIHYDPDGSQLRILQAEIHTAMGEPTAAAADLDAGLALHPNDPLLLIERGQRWRARGDYQKALADFEAARLVDPLKEADMLAAMARSVLAVGPTLVSLRNGAGQTGLAFELASAQPRPGTRSPVEVWTLGGQVHHCSILAGGLEEQAAFGRSASGYAVVLSSGEWALTPNASYPATVEDGSAVLTTQAIAFDAKTLGIPLPPDPALHAAWSGEILGAMTVKTAMMELHVDGADGEELAALDECWARVGGQPPANVSPTKP